MIEKPDREKMREKALRSKEYYENGGLQTPGKISPDTVLDLIDEIEALEARLATEREAGYMEAVELLSSEDAPRDVGGVYPYNGDWAEWLEKRWKEKQK